MNYFKPMHKDKSLKMVQDIEPNKAEHKLMQYSAMWNSTGEFIVEAGIEPVNVSKVTEKNELPYIFSQLCVNPDTSYFAVNAETEKIVGATDTELVGMDMKETISPAASIMWISSTSINSAILRSSYRSFLAPVFFSRI